MAVSGFPLKFQMLADVFLGKRRAGEFLWCYGRRNSYFGGEDGRLVRVKSLIVAAPERLRSRRCYLFRPLSPTPESPRLFFGSILNLYNNSSLTLLPHIRFLSPPSCPFFFAFRVFL